jgi:hypothetical protein
MNSYKENRSLVVHLSFCGNGHDILASDPHRLITQRHPLPEHVYDVYGSAGTMSALTNNT